MVQKIDNDPTNPATYVALEGMRVGGREGGWVAKPIC